MSLGRLALTTALAWLAVASATAYTASQHTITQGAAGSQWVRAPATPPAADDGYGLSWITSRDQLLDDTSESAAFVPRSSVIADESSVPGLLPPIQPSWQQAGSYVGRLATLQGLVKWCDFGNPEAITYSFDPAGQVVFLVPAALQLNFSFDQLRSYCGNVEVTGIVRADAQRFEITVGSPAQVSVLNVQTIVEE